MIAIGGRYRFKWFLPSPGDVVEVLRAPRSGDYKAGDRVVKIGLVVTVRFLEQHECLNECGPEHTFTARVDQLEQL